MQREGRSTADKPNPGWTARPLGILLMTCLVLANPVAAGSQPTTTIQEKQSDTQQGTGAEEKAEQEGKQEKDSAGDKTDDPNKPQQSSQKQTEQQNPSGGPDDPKPPVDNTPTPIDWSVEGTMDLNFDHLKFNIQPDEAFKIQQLTADLIKLRGHRIRIRGYIRPAFKSKDITKFILVRDNQECCFGPGAALYDCMIVDMKSGNSTDYTTRPITVEGTFQLKPFRGEDKVIRAIFNLKDAIVE